MSSRDGVRRRWPALFAIVPAAVLVLALAPAQATGSPPPSPSTTESESADPQPTDGSSSAAPDGDPTDEATKTSKPEPPSDTPQDSKHSELPGMAKRSEDAQTKQRAPAEDDPDQPKESEQSDKEQSEESAETKQAEQPQTMAAAAEPRCGNVERAVCEAMWTHRERLADRGVRNLGDQTGRARAVGAGARMTFDRGTVYWSREHRAHAVWGGILHKYERKGGPRGVLGFPATDERDTAVRGGRYSRFDHGRIYWSRGTGSHEIHGAIENKFLRLGGTRVLGLPETDERGTAVRGGRFSRFEHGRIYWSRRTGAHEIHGAIEKRFMTRGRTPRLGLPTTDERGPKRARYSVFQHARIYWSGRTGARVLVGGILRKYLRSGGHRAWFGLPTREEFNIRGGRRANFQRAGITWDRSSNRTRIVKAFSVTVHRVQRSDVRYTYRSGCPVPPRSLRRMRLVFTNFRGDAAIGNLIVHRNVVGDLTRVFRNAHRRGFNVRRIRPMDAYRGDDIRAMRDDNTSAFNCRHVTGNPYRLSQHSYGNAVDINTFENPYVTSSRVYPRGSRTYLNRSNVRKGMIVSSGPVARTMRRLGWPWGARWSNPDYQHFSSNGG